MRTPRPSRDHRRARRDRATVGSVTLTSTHTDAGTYSDSWSFTGAANYNNISSTSITDSIAKATAVIVVTPYTSATTTYDGNAHTATVTSITGVHGETGATVGAVDVSGTKHINAGTYNGDAWSFAGGANYNNGSGTVNDSIAKATAVIVVTPYTSATTTYDGLEHTAVVTSITGVHGEMGPPSARRCDGTTHQRRNLTATPEASRAPSYNDGSGRSATASPSECRHHDHPLQRHATAMRTASVARVWVKPDLRI